MAASGGGQNPLQRVYDLVERLAQGTRERFEKNEGRIKALEDENTARKVQSRRIRAGKNKGQEQEGQNDDEG